ncbi:LacI family DNA-binding transcriptional regulator [Akkermansiaceae bacterium]|nr:LacI family DNA-binding transcriptional regulator [Akkermansiaceae bacterium]
MPIFTVLSPAEQVADHLRDGLVQGRWRETMPGAPLLARELGIDPKTADAALRLLEGRGLLVPQGAGKRRRIELPPSGESVRPLRVAIGLGEPADRGADYLAELQHALIVAGHDAHFSEKCLLELDMDTEKIGKMVERGGADAWVLCGGSRGVLEWFVEQGTPTFAIFGRYDGLPIAGTRPNKLPAYRAAVEKLVGLGHRRIALLARSMRRLPEPGGSERAFLDALESHGIPTGTYNLPDWEDNREGFEELLTRLFQVTPPTALIIQESFLFHAAHHFITRHGLRVPEDVSLICTDADRTFSWCIPSVSHISWDSGAIIRRVVRWAAAIGNGKEDLLQVLTKAEFVEGGTIAPPPDR